MKYLMTAFAAAALLSLTLPASAQLYGQGYGYYGGMWPEMVDNGCCTDFPTHSPTDFMADQLNRQVLNYNAAPPMMLPPRY